jgi:hypothetical protein
MPVLERRALSVRCGCVAFAEDVDCEDDPETHCCCFCCHLRDCWDKRCDFCYNPIHINETAEPDGSHTCLLHRLAGLPQKTMCVVCAEAAGSKNAWQPNTVANWNCDGCDAVLVSYDQEQQDRHILMGASPAAARFHGSYCLKLDVALCRACCSRVP